MTLDPNATVQQSMTEAAGAIQRALESSRARLADAYSDMQQKSAQALEGAETYVQRSPLSALGYAAAIGALIGITAMLVMTSRPGRTSVTD